VQVVINVNWGNSLILWDLKVKWKSGILDVAIENAFHGGTLGFPNINHHEAIPYHERQD
jgi:hypothetical protein